MTRTIIRTLLLATLLGMAADGALHHLTGQTHPAPDPAPERAALDLRVCEASRDWYADRWFTCEDAVRALAGEETR